MELSDNFSNLPDNEIEDDDSVNSSGEDNDYDTEGEEHTEEQEDT